jgi:hypothetical protein
LKEHLAIRDTRLNGSKPNVALLTRKKALDLPLNDLEIVEFAFPNQHSLPAKLFESEDGLIISLSVPRNLFGPILGPCLRDPITPLTEMTVPEASMDKQRLLHCWKD